jgi:C-terminal processing protease CtpA/Prc
MPAFHGQSNPMNMSLRKMTLPILFLCIVCSTVKSQPKAGHQCITNFIKVWGFLKYYHPAIGTDKYDADSLFLQYIDKVLLSRSTAEYQNLLQSMLKELGPTLTQKTGKDTASLFIRNDGTAWINNDPMLLTSVRAQLVVLRKNGYTDSLHRYLPALFYTTDIPAEKKYDSIQYPNKAYQLLALARYWNAIEYLFPYKYMIGKNWNSILSEQAPFFSQSMTQAVFEKHLLQLNASINDTHGGYMPVKQPDKAYGNYFPPFAFRFNGDSIVVTDFIDSSACLQQDIQRGDVLIRLRGKSIAQNVKQQEDKVSASNLSKKKDILSSVRLLLPLRGFDSVVSTRFVRNGQVKDKQILLQQSSNEFRTRLNLLYRQETGNGTTTKNSFVLRSIDKDIAWIDAANLSILYNSTPDDVAIDSVLQKMRAHKKAIVLDLRCYATQAVFYNKFLPALGWKLKPFVTLRAHYMRFPGTYYTKDVFNAANQPPLLPLYTGKIILLVNEQTQSQSELITMILQASGPAVVVGTQTAGCDGDLLYMPIPGGYTMTFSGRHVEYPDGSPSQQSGIKLDVKVARTNTGIAEGRDEILTAALKKML